MRLLALQENTADGSQAGSKAAVPSSWTLCEAPPGLPSLPRRVPHMDEFVLRAHPQVQLREPRNPRAAGCVGLQ